MSDSGNQRELTFGEKAVGLTFNPSKDDDVHKTKQAFAAVIDLLNRRKQDFGEEASWIRNELFTAAFNACIAAQMAVVKYLTWGK